jgi:hypothetical protein
MRNTVYWEAVTRHLLSPVDHTKAAAQDNATLAEEIRRRYFDAIVPKVKQVMAIENRRWVEVELGLAPGTLKD